MQGVSVFVGRAPTVEPHRSDASPIHPTGNKANGQHMQSVLGLTVPFFALIFVGMLCRRRGFVSPADAMTLSRFAFYVAMPAMVFVKIAQGDAAQFLNWDFVWRYEMATISVFVASAGIGLAFMGLRRDEAGIFGLNAAYPNYGYMGIPLAILAFGDGAALVMALILCVDTIVLLVLTSLFVAGSNRGDSRAQMIGQMARTMMRNPLLIAAVAGLAVSASGLAVPGLVESTLELLAGAAPAVALFSLGATVYGQSPRSAAAQVTVISVARLVIHPAIVAFVMIAVPGQDPLWIKTAILVACLPVAANVYVLATHYGAYAERSSAAILTTTILASLSVPLVLYMLSYL